MGTNFYLRENCCNECNRFDEIHIGKRSAGWRFSMSALRHKTYAGWVEELTRVGTVWNEYGDSVPAAELLSSIQELQDLQSHETADPDRTRTWRDGPVDMILSEFS